MSTRWPGSLGTLVPVVTALGPAAVAQRTTDSAAPAQASEVQLPSPPQRGEDEDFVRSPNEAPLTPLPPHQEGLLETNIPSLRDGLSRSSGTWT